jgi:predicted CXXCH cytochrome family protein
MGDCTDCHNPHASKSPGLPKTTPVKICLDCHTDQAEQGKKAHLHQPAFDQGCNTCHEAHGSERPKLLRASGNNLCLECHGPDAKAKHAEGEPFYTIFDGKVKLPEDYYKKNRVVVLPIRYGQGHPTANHPVQDILDAANASVVKTPMNCLSCHQPHASAEANLLVKDQANNQAFCDTCHKNRLALTKSK